MLSFSIMLWLFYCLFISGMLVFVMSWFHIISTLLALESIALSIYFLLSSFSFYSSSSSYSALFYLAVAVCEGALGLSIIVLFARSSGSELFQNMSITAW